MCGFEFGQIRPHRHYITEVPVRALMPGFVGWGRVYSDVELWGKYFGQILPYRHSITEVPVHTRHRHSRGAKSRVRSACF
ncbi:MAG: hypothetical protein KME26_29540 [Oscillatoria princeps RMCB-10]|nr:hypothetical protein [Oscillatoria princeps RMCB-10]